MAKETASKSAPSEDVVTTAISEGVLTITLNRPATMNAFNAAMATRFLSLLQHEAAASTIRAVIITGAGKGFSAGQDLAELVDAEKSGNPLPLGPIVDRFNDIVRAIFGLPKPVIAAVNGAAAGAGANIALACDLVMASEEAYFVQSFIHVGLIPDSGGTYTLPRLVGLARARQMMLLGEKVKAADAVGMGMISRTVAASQLGAEAHACAVKLAALPTYAIGLLKRALDHSLCRSFGEQLGFEREAQILAAGSADYREGITAFLEKRKPIFRGV